MSEFDERLASLLADPDAMAQIMSLAQNLSGGADANTEAAAADKNASPPPEPSDVSSLFSNLAASVDPALLSRLIPVLSQLGRSESSETGAFLHALRPFLREERREKVEQAAQLAKMIHLAKVFLAAKED